MYCQNCGSEMAAGAKFCNECGAKAGVSQTESSVNILHLKCKSCNANMEADASRQEVFCSYCGAKMILLDSEAVAKEKVKAQAYKEVELAKIADAKEKRENDERKEETEKYRKSKLRGWCIAFMILTVLMSFGSFNSGKVLAGLIALVQACLFTASWLMGMNLVKRRGKSTHVLLAIAGFLLIILFVAASDIKASDKLEWEITELSATIPKPKSKYGSFHSYSGSLSADVDRCDKGDYKKYVEACKKSGYTIEAEETADSYKAFDSNGNHLRLNYYEHSERMSISLDAAEEMAVISWPKAGPGALVPAPASTLGHVDTDSSAYYSVYVGNTDREAFKKYCDACFEGGFNVDYSRSDDSFNAKNSAGYKLYIDYIGNSVMRIIINAPD